MSPDYVERKINHDANRKEAEAAEFTPSDHQGARTVKYAVGRGGDDRLSQTR